MSHSIGRSTAFFKREAWSFKLYKESCLIYDSGLATSISPPGEAEGGKFVLAWAAISKYHRLGGLKSSSPRTFWHRDQFRGRQFFHGRDGADGSGSNASDGERWGEADEASLACPRLTSCCAARFLTGRRLVPACSPGVRDPWLKQQTCIFSQFWRPKV